MSDLSAILAGLDVAESDVRAVKDGFSAFFPGKCDLHEQLKERSISHVIIAGTVTNVCCESSARDTVKLGYAITMMADGNAGHARGLHEASLNNMFRNFGDVRSADNIVKAMHERALR